MAIDAAPMMAGCCRREHGSATEIRQPAAAACISHGPAVECPLPVRPTDRPKIEF
jgi:hypothetical protein